MPTSDGASVEPTEAAQPVPAAPSVEREVAAVATAAVAMAPAGGEQASPGVSDLIARPPVLPVGASEPAGVLPVADPAAPPWEDAAGFDLPGGETAAGAAEEGAPPAARRRRRRRGSAPPNGQSLPPGRQDQGYSGRAGGQRAPAGGWPVGGNRQYGGGVRGGDQPGGYSSRGSRQGGSGQRGYQPGAYGRRQPGAFIGQAAGAQQPASGYRALGKTPEELQRLQEEARRTNRWRGFRGRGGGRGPTEEYRSLGRPVPPQSTYNQIGRNDWSQAGRTPAGEDGAQGAGGRRRRRSPRGQGDYPGAQNNQ